MIEETVPCKVADIFRLSSLVVEQGAGPVFLCPCVPITNIKPYVSIRQTCPRNVYPFNPHFYKVKLGYAVVYLFFLFLIQNIYCGYSLEPPRRGGSNVYPPSMFS